MKRIALALAAIAMLSPAAPADTGTMTIRCFGITGTLGDAEFHNTEVVFTAVYDTNDILEQPWTQSLFTAPILYATVSVPGVGDADVLADGVVTAWTNEHGAHIPGGLAISFPGFFQPDFTLEGLGYPEQFEDLNYDLTYSFGPVDVAFVNHDVGYWRYGLETSGGWLIVKPEGASPGEAGVEVGGK